MSIDAVRQLFVGFVLLISSPILLAQDDGNDEEVTEPGGNVCVNIRLINGFNPINNEFLHVTASGRKHYLFTMERSCTGLRSASNIAIVDSMSRVCSNSLSRIAYRDMGLGRTSCRILNIEEVASRDDARALAEAHKEARKKKD